MSVVRLASTSEPRTKPCGSCRFFHPNTNLFGQDFGGWFKPWKPSALAIHHAQCSAFGGDYASRERETKCHGDYWEPAISERTGR